MRGGPELPEASLIRRAYDPASPRCASIGLPSVDLGDRIEALVATRSDVVSGRSADRDIAPRSFSLTGGKPRGMHRAQFRPSTRTLTTTWRASDEHAMDSSTGTGPGGDRRRGHPHPRSARAVLCRSRPRPDNEKDLFELKKVGDGVYAAVAATPLQGQLQRRGDRDQRRPGDRRHPLQAVGGPGPLQGNPGRHQQARAQDHQHALPLGSLAGERGLCGGQSRPGDRHVPADAGQPDPAGRRRRAASPTSRSRSLPCPAEIQTLKDDITKASGPEVKARLESNLRQAEAYLQELKQMKPTLPTRTVSTTVTLNEGGREIQLQLPGPRPHRRGPLHLSSQGEGGGDRGRGGRLDALPQRRLPRGVGADPGGARTARLHADDPRPRQRRPQGASDVLPRVPDGSRRRREEGVGRRAPPSTR